MEGIGWEALVAVSAALKLRSRERPQLTIQTPDLSVPPQSFPLSENRSTNSHPSSAQLGDQFFTQAKFLHLPPRRKLFLSPGGRCCLADSGSTGASSGGSSAETRSSRESAETERVSLKSWLRNRLGMQWVSLQLRLGLNPINRVSAPSNAPPSVALPRRQKLVILGTGWGSLSMIPDIDVRKYDVTIVSPRNYFTFTPLLPSVCSGTLSPRAALEPIRNFTLRGGKKVMDFYEAAATDVQVDQQTVLCQTRTGEKFSLDYDVLVLGVGSETNTFGVPGANKYCQFLKEVENARDIHRKVLDNFERAGLPKTPDSVRKQLLHFVVIGGGPTGVETAAEVSDLINEDILVHFPHLREHARVTVIEMLPRLLPMFSKEVSQFVQKNFDAMKVNTLLNTKVTSVHEQEVSLQRRTTEGVVDESVPYGLIVWASGVGPLSFTKKFLSNLSDQRNKSIVSVDPQLRVLGCKNVYAVGDCARIQTPLMHTNEALVCQLFQQSQTHPQKASTDFLESQVGSLKLTYPQLSPSKCEFQKLPRKVHLSKDEFRDLLKSIDNAYVPPAPTAQYATQEGTYLALSLNQLCNENDKAKAPAFVENYKGKLAYVGHGQAVADLPGDKQILGGIISVLLWKAVYVQLLKSLRTTIIVLSDWGRTFVGGRDVGRDHIRDTTPAGELYRK